MDELGGGLVAMDGLVAPMSEEEAITLRVLYQNFPGLDFQQRLDMRRLCGEVLRLQERERQLQLALGDRLMEKTAAGLKQVWLARAFDGPGWQPELLGVFATRARADAFCRGLEGFVELPDGSWILNDNHRRRLTVEYAEVQ